MNVEIDFVPDLELDNYIYNKGCATKYQIAQKRSLAKLFISNFRISVHYSVNIKSKPEIENNEKSNEDNGKKYNYHMARCVAGLNFSNDSTEIIEYSE